MTTAGYDLRKMKRKDHVQLPRLRASVKQEEKLYELDIIEDVFTQRVNVHYIGYRSEDDKWRNADEIVNLKLKLPGINRMITRARTYCVHNYCFFLHRITRSISPSH